MNTAFVSEFARRVQGQSCPMHVAFPLTWIERNYPNQGWTIERSVS